MSDQDHNDSCWQQAEDGQRRLAEDPEYSNCLRTAFFMAGHDEWIRGCNEAANKLYGGTEMDMTQYAGSESKYIKAADLQGKTVKVTIESVALLEFDDDDKGKIEKPALSLVGKEKQVVCNKTAVNDLISAYGPDSDYWAGKDIRLSVKHYPKFGKDGIVIAPIIEEDFNDSVPF